MQINFNNEHKVILNILFEDLIGVTRKAGDKVSTKRAERIKNKLDFNTKVSFLKPKEIKLISDMILHTIETSMQTDTSNMDENSKEVRSDNIKKFIELRTFIHETVNLRNN